MAASPAADSAKRRIESAFRGLEPKRQRPDARARDAAALGGDGASLAAGATGKCRPWSTEDLLARIGTYKMHTWLALSPALSPVRCARNGWVNSDCNTLECRACSAVLIAEIPDDLAVDEEVRWVGRLAEQLQSSHDAECPWRGHACSGSTYSVPLLTSREAVDDICQRAAELLESRAQLPALDHPLSAFQLSLLRDLCRNVVAIRKEVEPDGAASADGRVLSAVLLTLFGWRRDRPGPRPTITCSMCLRSAGLWLFRGADSHGGEDESPTRPFSVVGEHRAFCYWVRGQDVESELAAEANPGWKNTMASVLRARTIAGDGISDSSSESGPGDDSGTADGGGDGGPDGAEAVLKKLKPFNISAISSAAEAFGIPFSKALLTQAIKLLSPSSGPPPPLPSPLAAAGTAADAGAWPGRGPPAQSPAADDGVREAEDGGRETWRADDTDDDIPASIDTSGLAAFLEGGTLASALEDPAKAKAILEYVKDLLRAKSSSQAQTST
ncbi:hypothetical protein IWQ56_005297 [Coemansia nantahalensis]|nr:hypothetical protein IWQ56_005297 [Coemansia nantahalensis]